MMAMVAVIAFDCFAWTMTGGAGILLIGPALIVGFVCWWRAKDKRFWLGFDVAGLAAVLAYIGYIRAGNPLPIFPAAVILLLLLSGGSPPVNSPLITQVVICEASYGLPMLLVASIG